MSSMERKQQVDEMVSVERYYDTRVQEYEDEEESLDGEQVVNMVHEENFDEKEELFDYMAADLVGATSHELDKDLTKTDRLDHIDNDEYGEDDEDDDDDERVTHTGDILAANDAVGKEPERRISVHRMYVTKMSPPASSPLDNKVVDDTDELGFLSKLYYDEKYIYDLKDVECVCSVTNQPPSTNYREAKEAKNILYKLSGRLILTSYRLVFVPVGNMHTKSHILFEPDKRLEIFKCDKLPYSVVIPLTYIYEIRAATVSSEKHRKLSSVIESNSSSIRDIVITCKNFMKKRFFFNNSTIVNSENTIDFARLLQFYSHHHSIIHNRFHYLIQRLNATPKSNETPDSQHKEDNNQKRKSYLVPNHLQEDLIECKCDSYMQVKSGYAEVIPDKFKIETSMPFCVLPKNIADIILKRRVVLNDQHVAEFIEFDSSNNVNDANKRHTTHLPTSTQPNHTKSPSTSSISTGKKLSKFLGGSSNAGASPRSATLQPLLNQPPILANVSYSNPFVENKFPIWSLTESGSGCSLIIVPEAISGRQEECDIIIKNYNSLLWDEHIKSKSIKQPTVKVSSQAYADYEFYKLQVPVSYDKIGSSYTKLLKLCSFTSYSEFYQDSDVFLTRLSDTKWLKQVSKMLSLTNKIVNCLRTHNVFLEEKRHNTDCSCILTSLVKICLNSKYRTIRGLENLIQKEWFLAGHCFLNRLNSTPWASRSAALAQELTENNNNNYQAMPPYKPSRTDEQDFAPSFLLFLDCLFQLLIQCPNEFEFTEIYLIHLWDYSLSGLSFTYSFNGVNHWFEYLNNQTFLTSSNLPIEAFSSINLSTRQSSSPHVTNNNQYLEEIFDANSLFWQTHLNENWHLMVNKNFQIKPVIINPCDKMYMIKFWSRCYLRWLEKYHSYTPACNNEAVEEVKDESSSIKPSRPAPPPPPPKPTHKYTQSESGVVAASNQQQLDKFHIQTRVTSEGNFESSL